MLPVCAISSVTRMIELGVLEAKKVSLSVVYRPCDGSFKEYENISQAHVLTSVLALRIRNVVLVVYASRRSYHFYRPHRRYIYIKTYLNVATTLSRIQASI